MEAIIRPRPVTHVVNPLAREDGPPDAEAAAVLDADRLAAAGAEIRTWPGYAPSPLVPLPGIARAAGIGGLYWKDESRRFGLGSFKALGGAYAVLRLLQCRLARRGIDPIPDSAALRAGACREILRRVTVTCATDGNHGRSVAWGAALFGCRCVIYLHETVSSGREAAIARFGAEIRRVPGNYDDAVRRCAEDAARAGWFVVSDTSWPGYTDLPRHVMHGYAVMADEILCQLPTGLRPTHLFLQGGVGGLAAAVAWRFHEAYGAARPRVVVVEPERAACILESLRAGEPVAVHGELDTVMVGLACGEVSLLAWQVLKGVADDALAVPDGSALDCMRLLADPPFGDPPLVAGESAVAGLAGLLLAASDPGLRSALDLGPDSRVVLIGSEGATDPELYARIVGRPAEAVRISA